MNHLDRLESASIHILREANWTVPSLCMLWSVGKDSTVLLWLARKAFFGAVPFPLVHIDTSFKIPEMIAFRDYLAMAWKLTLIVGRNRDAIDAGQTFPNGAIDRLSCCAALKTETLMHTLAGDWPRYVLDHTSGSWREDENPQPFRGVVAGIRADEEGSRAKERCFSVRTPRNQWQVGQQPPEFWGHFNTDVPEGSHIRIHPLLDWTELNVWEYIQRESIPTVSLYYSQDGRRRYRSVGCAPCTCPVKSSAHSVDEVVNELRTGQFANVSERAGRAQDLEDGGGLETLRRAGYM